MPKPNILIFMADDLGFGDVVINNPDAHNIDDGGLSSFFEGAINFTDMHSPAAVCTPSRTSLMTGRHCQRFYPQSGVLEANAGWPTIGIGEVTLADMLKDNGYATAHFGKWHCGRVAPAVGGGWATEYQAVGGGLSYNRGNPANVDYSSDTVLGPDDHGIDVVRGYDAKNLHPYSEIEERRWKYTPDEEKPLPLAPDERSGWWSSTTFVSAEADNVALDEAKTWITDRVDNHPSIPIFCNFWMHSPHTPYLVPNDSQGVNSSGRSNLVHHFGEVLSELVNHLDTKGILSDTLIIVTSDHGALDDSIEHNNGHDNQGGISGHKGDFWSGGHLVPFAMRWDAQGWTGGERTMPLNYIHLAKTLADIIGAEVPAHWFRDGRQSFLPELEGTRTTGHPVQRIQARNGDVIVRTPEGNWSIEGNLGSGGTTGTTEIEPGPGDPGGQYYLAGTFRTLDTVGLTDNRWADFQTAAELAVARYEKIPLADEGKTFDAFMARQFPVIWSKTTDPITNESHLGGVVSSSGISFVSSDSPIKNRPGGVVVETTADDGGFQVDLSSTPQFMIEASVTFGLWVKNLTPGDTSNQRGDNPFMQIVLDGNGSQLDTGIAYHNSGSGGIVQILSNGNRRGTEVDIYDWRRAVVVLKPGVQSKLYIDGVESADDVNQVNISFPSRPIASMTIGMNAVSGGKSSGLRISDPFVLPGVEWSAADAAKDYEMGILVPPKPQLAWR